MQLANPGLHYPCIQWNDIYLIFKLIQIVRGLPYGLTDVFDHLTTHPWAIAIQEIL